MAVSEPTRRVSLALGSGGARGYAHIGVIQELEERGYEIAAVAGSSMGALVGGLYAADKLDDFTDWAVTLKQLDVIRLLDPAISAAGAIRAERILDIVREMLDDVTIDLRIPYTAVATDLISGREVWFQRGPLHTAIRGSIAIPGVIAPHEVDGQLLADGGILDPLPVMANASVNVRHTIAVSLGAEDRDGGEPESTQSWIERARRGAAEVGGPVSTVVEYLTGPVDEDAPAPARSLVPKFSRVDVLNRSLDIVTAALTRHHLAAQPPDVLVEIPRTAGRALDFHRATEMIDIGREAAVTALDLAGLDGVAQEPADEA